MIMTALVAKFRLGVEHSSGGLYFHFLPHLDDLLEW